MLSRTQLLGTASRRSRLLLTRQAKSNSSSQPRKDNVVTTKQCHSSLEVKPCRRWRAGISLTSLLVPSRHKYDNFPPNQIAQEQINIASSSHKEFKLVTNMASVGVLPEACRGHSLTLQLTWIAEGFLTADLSALETALDASYAGPSYQMNSAASTAVFIPSMKLQDSTLGLYDF